MGVGWVMRFRFWTNGQNDGGEGGGMTEVEAGMRGGGSAYSGLIPAIL